MELPTQRAPQASRRRPSSKARAPNVVVDRELITGQNPLSDHALAKALLGKLERQFAQ